MKKTQNTYNLASYKKYNIKSTLCQVYNRQSLIHRHLGKSSFVAKLLPARPFGACVLVRYGGQGESVAFILKAVTD